MTLARSLSLPTAFISVRLALRVGRFAEETGEALPAVRLLNESCKPVVASLCKRQVKDCSNTNTDVGESSGPVLAPGSLSKQVKQQREQTTQQKWEGSLAKASRPDSLLRHQGLKQALPIIAFALAITEKNNGKQRLPFHFSLTCQTPATRAAGDSNQP